MEGLEETGESRKPGRGTRPDELEGQQEVREFQEVVGGVKGGAGLHGVVAGELRATRQGIGVKEQT